MIICQFKHADGRWNLVEGTINSGRVQCLICGQIYPPPSYPPRKFLPDEWSRSNCLGSTKREPAKAAVKKTCPENCLLNAQKHLAGFAEEMQRAASKTTDPKLKQQITQALDEFTSSAKLPDFAPLLAGAVRQALAEGRAG